jgi:tetratricopeptide (TPR) repeat protein
MDVTALNNIGEIRSDQGRLAEALDAFDEALHICRSIRFPVGQALALSNLGRAASRNGRFEDAAKLLAEARAMFDRIGANGFVVEVDAREAERLLFAGEATAAFDVAVRTEDSAKASGLPGAYALLGRVAGVALALTGEIDAARRRLDDARRRAADGKLDYELGLTLDAAAAVASITASADAEALRISAATILDRLGVVNVEAVSTSRLVVPVSITIPEQRTPA